MKKIVILLITLIIFFNINYASFPVVEMIDNEIITSTDSEGKDSIETLFGINFDNGKNPNLSVFILPWLIPILLFYLIRGYKRDVDWIRKLIRWKNIWWLLLAIPLVMLIDFLLFWYWWNWA
tara:strand:- start:1107 stop:1472 length:366 start_codon:yes stop_codon:yes gene_type:complete